MLNGRDLTSGSAGTRTEHQLVDATARGGYSLTGAQPSDKYEAASEYLNVRNNY